MSTPAPRPRWWAKVLTAALGVLLALGVAASVEFASREVLRAKKRTTYPLFYDRAKDRGVLGGPGYNYLDPHLGHAHEPEALAKAFPDLTYVPGFMVYGDPREKRAIRIVTLGGSTTDPRVRQAWPELLRERLLARGYRVVVFNGGVAGYSSNQELVKLIRDVLPLGPQLIISLNGVNDLGFAHSVKTHPMVHPYQQDVMEQLVRGGRVGRVFPNTTAMTESMLAARGSLRGVNYGPVVRTTPGRQWERNVRLMAAVARELSIPYLCFRQPVLGAGEFDLSPAEREMVRRYAGDTGAAAATPARATYLDVVKAFYTETTEVCARLPYCVDLANIFRGRTGVYSDARHQTVEGRTVIAEAIGAEIVRRGLIGRPPAKAGGAP